MTKWLSGLAILIVFISCEEIKNDETALPPSTGKYGEVLIVVDTLYENRETGQELSQIFFKALEGLPQKESQFRASTVSPKAFKSILKRSRNVLNLSIGRGKKTNINVERDIWAKDQLVIQITANSDETAARILRKNLETIRNYYNEEEIMRLQKQIRNKPQQSVMEELKEKYGVNMIIPPGYVEMLAKQQGVWFKKEKKIGQHLVIQGICLQVTDYESDSSFANTEMIRLRDEFTKEHIQGFRDNSFMIVYDEYNPVQQEINLNGLYAKEFRGLWKMKNDFMGGPFVHYTFVDEKKNRLVNIDGFVYAPKFNKREYLRELEAILKTATIN